MRLVKVTSGVAIIVVVVIIILRSLERPRRLRASGGAGVADESGLAFS